MHWLYVFINWRVLAECYITSNKTQIQMVSASLDLYMLTGKCSFRSHLSFNLTTAWLLQLYLFSKSILWIIWNAGKWKKKKKDKTRQIAKRFSSVSRKDISWNKAHSTESHHYHSLVTGQTLCCFTSFDPDIPKSIIVLCLYNAFWVGSRLSKNCNHWYVVSVDCRRITT